MAVSYSAVIFDLDGTLLDTLTDLANAANAALTRFGFPTYAVGSYRQLIGEGVDLLFMRALPADARRPEWVRQMVAAFQEAYASHWNVHTKPYPQIPQLLDTLRGKQVRMAVLSNKPDLSAKRCVAEFLPDKGLEIVLGQRDGVPPKPDPAGARAIVHALHVPASACLYLGDSGVDMQVAHHTGMIAVGALWGYRTREELEQHGASALIEQPLDLLEL
ncbi:MAG: hypothetical protein A2W31_11300 [Planctomycetes bacterium RBG_16_64_10]|nr:MAG: hypothetical protein A2W31_11300 [Planctomycetes bacterium RBG_16_64_10]